MSTSSSLQHQVAHETAESKRKDRPPALTIPFSNNGPDGDVRLQRKSAEGRDHGHQVRRVASLQRSLLTLLWIRSLA
jgi:hypothetical protein